MLFNPSVTVWHPPEGETFDMTTTTMSPARARVLDAATRLYVKEGFACVSMRDLAKELGMQAPSLYSHFKSKDLLLTAVLEPLRLKVDQLLDDAPLSDVTTAQRRAWLCRYIEMVDGERDLVRLAYHDATVRNHPYWRAQLAEHTTKMVNILAGFGVHDRRAALSVVGYMNYPALWDQRLNPKEQSEVIDEVELLIAYADGNKHKKGR